MQHLHGDSHQLWGQEAAALQLGSAAQHQLITLCLTTSLTLFDPGTADHLLLCMVIKFLEALHHITIQLLGPHNWQPCCNAMHVLWTDMNRLECADSFSKGGC